MAKGSRKKGVAFPENNSWYHRTKTLKEDGTITYSKKGGFATEDAAVASYWQYEKEFNTAYKKYQITNQINSDIFFRDYLIYWFEEEFSSRIESTTRMVGAYAIYYLILPQIDYDIKLRHVSVDYLNNLLEKIARICNKSGLPPITVHGLRHMYATILIEMGVPLVKISALLGHGSIHTTFEYNCDVMDENENILAFIH